MYNELLFSTILLLVANSADIGTSYDTLITTSTDLALNSIKEADLAGADVSELISRFNLASGLIDGAENEQFSSCASYDDCNEKATGVLVAITNNANMQKEQAASVSSLQRLMNFGVYIPLSAFVTAILVYGLVRIWRWHKMNRLLAMEVVEEE